MSDYNKSDDEYQGENTVFDTIAALIMGVSVILLTSFVLAAITLISFSLLVY